jgi:predicted amidohydrolase YtcJ
MAGKLADLVILGRDVTAIPPEQVADVKVVMTLVGGRIAYDATVERSGGR